MASNESILIRTEGLSRRFVRREALHAVSFQVPRGRITGLLGPNGSGKTTLLRILAGYLAPTAGRVEVAGMDVTLQSLKVRRKIGYLPETTPLYPEMRVEEYLVFRGRLKGLRGSRLQSRFRDVVEQGGLGDILRQTIGGLSRGLRQRIGLADCLLAEPDVLLLDEPFAGLDAGQCRQFSECLLALRSQSAVLFSTHHLAEARQLCDSVLILNDGRVAAWDSPAALVRNAGGAGVDAAVFEEVFMRLTTLPPKVRNPMQRQPA